MVTAGMSLTTPTLVNLSGEGSSQSARYFTNSPDSFHVSTGFIDVDFQIPLRLDFGLGLTIGNLLLTADVGYQDWTEARIDDRGIKDLDLEPIFREVIDFKIGAEFIIPRTPFRLRGGYAQLPFPLEYLQADRIGGNQLQQADVTLDRRLVAVGAGGLLGKIMTFDLAYQWTVNERSIPTLVDHRTTQRFLLSAKYRF